MDYNPYEHKIEKIEYDGRKIEIKIPNKLMQKFICNCDKINDKDLGDPCDRCKYKNY